MSNSTRTASDLHRRAVCRKICTKCGKQKEFLHGERCRRVRTKAYIEAVYKGLSKDAPECSNLKRVGMDEVTLLWCQKALAIVEGVESIANQEFILQNVADVITASDGMLNYPQCEDKCSVCNKKFGKCAEDRAATWKNIKTAINERIDFGGQNHRLDIITDLTHFGLDITVALVKVFDVAVEEENNERVQISVQLLSNFLSENIALSQMCQVIAGVDASIGW